VIAMSLINVRLCLQVFYRHYKHSPIQASAILVGIILAVTLLIGVKATNENAIQSYSSATELLSQRASFNLSNNSSSDINEQVYFALSQAGIDSLAIIEGLATSPDGQLWQVTGSDVVSALAHSAKNTTISSASLTSSTIDLSQLLNGQPTIMMSQSQAKRIAPNGDFTLNNIKLNVLQVDDKLGLGSALLMDMSLAQPLLNMQGKLSYIAVFAPTTTAPEVLSPNNPRSFEQSIKQTLLAAGIDTNRINITTVDKGEALGALTESFHLNLNAMSMLAFVVGLFIAYNGVRYSLMKRQKLFVQLMQQGIDKFSLMTALLCELLTLVLIGCIIGFITGLQLSQWLQPMVALTLEQLYDARLMPGIWQWSWFLQAFGLTLASAMGACIPMLTNLINTPLAQGTHKQERHYRRLHRKQFYLGVVMLLGAFLLFNLTENYRYSLALLGVVTIAIPLLLPQLLGSMLTLITPLFPKGLWQYGVAETKDIIAPLSLAMMAMLLAICANISMNTLVGSFEITLKQWLNARLHADLYIIPNPSDMSKLEGFLQQQPKVTGVYQQWKTSAIISSAALSSSTTPAAEIESTSTNTPISLISRDIYSLKNTTIFKGQTPQFWQDFGASNSIMISEPLAIKLNLQLGSKVQIDRLTASSMTVGAIYYDYGNPMGEAIIHHLTWQTNKLPIKPISLAIIYAGELNEIQQQLTQTLGISSAQMYSQQGIKSQAIEIFKRTFSITVVLNSLTLLVAAIGLFSACIMLTQARLAPLARLYALGVNRQQLRVMVLSQMLIIVFLTCLLAMPTGALLGYLLINKVTLQAFGWTIAMVWDWQAYAQVVLIALASSVIAVCLPLYWQTRKPLISSLQQEVL
jgi:putative ABC transport system permease protein